VSTATNLVSRLHLDLNIFQGFYITVVVVVVVVVGLIDGSGSTFQYTLFINSRNNFVSIILSTY
jgi:hypothetical protein